MKFYKLNEGGAKRDDGVVVQIKHPDYLEYTEGDLSVDVSIGYDPSTRQIFVYASELTNWSRPTSVVPISDVKKQEIAQNLKEALGALKGKFVVS
ncbi:hypothetical protein [Pseudomonas sp. B28(2017)]|uniref:hypothetical protein n=1 Tax=Pseudomonas sp. B28(2017) TaxID=1981730 RepID=UPI000A1E9AE6|nr:hypothetical protein [Pseudomonas sp. B28(2017)]